MRLMRLKRDITIPAGTIFDEAPIKTQRCGGVHFEHIFGLSKDSTGHLVYAIEPDTVEAGGQLEEFFEVVQDDGGKI